jgi:GNAT superfamily N-acetyltransferase
MPEPTIDISELDEDDLDWATAVIHDWDGTDPVEFQRRRLAGDAGRVLAAVVARVGVQRVGLAFVIQPAGLPHPILTVLVTPEHRGQGIGSALHEAIGARLPDAILMTGLADDDPLSLAVVQRWGFEIQGHGIDSALDLASMPEPRPLAAGVREVHVLASEVLESPWDVDGFLDEVGDFPEVESYGMTLDNDDFVEFSTQTVWVLLVDDSGILSGTAIAPMGPGVWHVAFTGSRPRVRGRGLARAAKERAHAYARVHGATVVRTKNEERNVRMRGLNAALGYVPDGGQLRLVRIPASGGVSGR